ncbi:hypothetical protein KKE60_06575 [Patescibacteria group bacterium]|nr:hypothetical protein [Patescibacteria group bacterium]
MVSAARQSCSSLERKSKSWKIKNKFIVRGHWRDQAVGKDWSEHKRIWIEPYWKGPDTAKGYAHLYDTIVEG